MITAHIPVNTLTATRAFAERIAQAYPTQKAILFGSRARGTEHDESDADVAIILKGAVGPFIKTKMAMNDIAYHSVGHRNPHSAAARLGNRMGASTKLQQPAFAAQHRA